MNSQSDDIFELRNLGPTSAAWLHNVGITTQHQLRLLGPVVAYQIVRNRIPKANLNLLWALAAGLNDQDWRELTTEQKHQLVEELQRLTLPSNE